MDRATYLKAIEEAPWRFPEAAGCPQPPAEWVAAAWDSEAVQGCIAAEITHNVSANGEMLTGQEFLAWLSAVLSTEQVVRFFRQLRDGSPHRESEFRPRFVAAFARHASALPAPLSREEVAADLRSRGFDEATASELMGEGHSPDAMPPDDGIPY